MSDTSLLSHRYRGVADFSEAIDHGFLDLHKERLQRKPGTEQQTRGGESFLRLADLLLALLVRLDSSRVPTNLAAREHSVPAPILDRVRQDEFLVRRLTEALEPLVEMLRSHPREVGEQELQLLDSLARLADEEASRTFRRLMRH